MARKKRGFATFRDSLQYRFSFNGKRYAVYGHTQQECEDKATELKEKLKRHIYIGNDNITISQYFNEWNERREGTVKESTLYAGKIRFARIEPELGKYKIANIEPRQIHALQKKLIKDGNLTTQGINLTMSLLNSIMKSAVIDRIIMLNPCDGIRQLKRTEATAAETYHRALTKEEQRLFFDAAKQYSGYYTFFAFLVSTGCRAGEASALQWNDIDRKNKVIHIRRTLTRISDKEYTVGTPKTKTSLRDIPLTSEIENLLDIQRKQMTDLYGEKIIHLDGRIFQATNGDYIKPQSTGGCIKAILRHVKADTGTEIEYFSCHAFRDTFATRAIESGMNPQTLKTILGHASLAMTMDLYSHVLPNTKAEEMGRLKVIV